MSGVDLSRSALWVNGRKPTEAFQRALVNVALAAKASEPILLVGPSCYKSLLVRTWAEITGQEEDLVSVNLLQDTETSDILGQIQPHSFRDLVALVGHSLQIVTARLSAHVETFAPDVASDIVKIQSIIAPRHGSSPLQDLLLKVCLLYTSPSPRDRG
eukprot:380087-Rhodomonas_salina.1